MAICRNVAELWQSNGFGATVCKTVPLCYRTIVCPVLSVCDSDIGVLWPNGWMHQDTTWFGGRPRPGPHCVRW